MAWWLWLTAIAAQAPAAETPPQPDSRAVIAEHRLAIGEAGDGYAGPGWDRLLEEAAGAQFFMVGEQHGTADIALFATQLHAALTPRGYTHYAVEIGPWSTNFAEALSRSGPGRLAAYIREPGHAFIFPFLFFEEEVRLAEQAVAASPDPRHALFGLDQEFIGSGALIAELLRREARTPAQREAAEAFARQAAANPMLVGTVGAAELDPLAAAFAGHEDAETLIEELRRTARIYAPFVLRNGPTQPANLLRETQMKVNFLRYFESAERRIGRPPRVFLKFGGNHAMRGFSLTDVPGFGGFLDEWGLSRGFRMVNLMVDCIGGEALNPQTNAPAPCQPYFGRDTAIGSMASSDRLTLIDLKALRPRLRQMTDLDERSRRTILAFDYYLAIRDVRAATPTVPGARAPGQ